MACQTGTLVQHGEPGVGAPLEVRQRLVASGSFVMASHAGVGNVTSCTFLTVQRGEFTVHIIPPAHGMRCRLHSLVAGIATLLRSGRGRYAGVAHVAGRARLRSFDVVRYPETFIVECRFEQT